MHYWVKQPGKKSFAASVKSKSSMGKPWTENSKAVINFSPHCSHHLHWGLWGKSTASLCSQSGRPQEALSSAPQHTVTNTTWALPIHTDRMTATSEGGRARERELVWGSVRGGKIRTPHTQTPWSVQIAYRLTVTVILLTAPFGTLDARCQCLFYIS